MLYSVTKTEDIKNNENLPAGLSAGDVIETTGFYAAGDGGAGTFAVRAKETGETADNTFTYALGSNLIAELQTPDGVVNVDQLGAKGNGWVDDRIYSNGNMTTTTAGSIATNQYEHNQNSHDEIDWFSVTEAIVRYGIREIQFSPGKIYPISDIELSELSDLTINGNGAILIDDRQICYSPRFSCFDLTRVVFRNIQFTRLTLVQQSTIYMDGCSHITLDDVRFVFGCNALELTACDHVRMHNVRVHAHESMITAQGLTYSSLTDMVFSASRVPDDNDNNTVTYQIMSFSANTAHCLLQNVILEDAPSSNAISLQNTGNNMLCDILVQTTKNGLTILNSHDTDVHSVVVKNADNALKVSDTQNIQVSHCLFGGKEQQPVQNTNPVPLIDLGTVRNENLRLFGCTLRAPCVWFRVTDRAVSGDNITFADCRFYVDAGPSDALYVPASFASPLSFMHFDSCTFETSGFPQGMAGNEQLFALYGTSGTDSLVVFSSCRFRNGGTEANSPIRVDTQNRADLYALVKDCLLEGFRWTMRISGANESQASVTTTIINPAFSAWPDSTNKAAAITCMDNIASFGATGNLYFLTSAASAPYYMAGEQYGIAD